jgi:hypothetical protein
VKGHDVKKTVGLVFLLIRYAPSALGQGTVLWDESANGELGMDAGSATVLASIQIGTNSIIGATEVVPTGPNWAVHQDLFSITVPSNLSLSGVFLSINKPNVWTWIGDPTFANQLAFVQNPSSGNLMSQWGLGSIGPGVYGMYLANEDLQSVTSIASYRLDFIAQSIPEPGILGLLLIGAAFAGFYGLRRVKVRKG